MSRKSAPIRSMSRRSAADKSFETLVKGLHARDDVDGLELILQIMCVVESVDAIDNEVLSSAILSEVAAHAPSPVRMHRALLAAQGAAS